MKKLNPDLVNDPIAKAITLFALPMLVSFLFQQLYNTVDTVVVGNFLGEMPLAAIGATTAIFNLLIGFAIGIGSGFSIVTARYYGAGDKKMLKRTVAGALLIGALFVVIMMIISHFFIYDLLLLLNTPENIIDRAYSYIYIITMAVGVMFIYNLCAGMLRAIGNSFMPLVFLVISSILNIALDILLIAYFGMGIEGAAVATVIAQGISTVLIIIYIYKKTPILVPKRNTSL